MEEMIIRDGGLKAVRPSEPWGAVRRPPEPFRVAGKEDDEGKADNEGCGDQSRPSVRAVGCRPPSARAV